MIYPVEGVKLYGDCCPIVEVLQNQTGTYLSIWKHIDEEVRYTVAEGTVDTSNGGWMDDGVKRLTEKILVISDNYIEALLELSKLMLTTTQDSKYL